MSSVRWTGFQWVSAHDSGETREKKQAVNPLKSTDSACLHSRCRFLWSNGWGGRGSCGAAEGQLYITLLKVITEILKWNHSAARVCSNPLQCCLGWGRGWGLTEDLHAQHSFSLPHLCFLSSGQACKEPPHRNMAYPVAISTARLGTWRTERKGSVRKQKRAHTLQRSWKRNKG